MCSGKFPFKNHAKEADGAHQHSTVLVWLELRNLDIGAEAEGLAGFFGSVKLWNFLLMILCRVCFNFWC